MHQYQIVFTDNTSETVSFPDDLTLFPGEHQIRIWARTEYPGREIASVALIA
jgi:hypothetical protein